MSQILILTLGTVLQVESFSGVVLGAQAPNLFFFQKKSLPTLGFSFGQRPSRNLQLFGEKTIQVYCYSSEYVGQTFRYKRKVSPKTM